MLHAPEPQVIVKFECGMEVKAEDQMDAGFPRLPSFEDGQLVVTGAGFKRADGCAIPRELEVRRDLGNGIILHLRPRQAV